MAVPFSKKNAHHTRKSTCDGSEAGTPASWRVRRLPREDLASCEHRRGDAAAFMNFGENHRDEVERDKQPEGVESDFMDLDKRPAQRAHGLVGRLVDDVRGAWLDERRVNAGSGDPLCEPVAERRPEQIGSGDDKAGRQLDEQKQKQQGHPDAGNRIMAHKLLRFSGQKRRRVSA